MIDSIYGLTPINKTSGKVVSQSGCSKTGIITKDQQRANLVSKSQKWQKEIKLLPKGSAERKELGKKLAELNIQISELKEFKTKRGIHHYIIDIVKERMTKPEWERLIEEANKRIMTQ